MVKQANMVPIAVIASDICDNFGDSDRKYFGEHLKNVIATYHFLYVFISKNVSVKTVTLSPDNIVELPCDFVRETKLGIINPFGRIATMSVDKNLRIPPNAGTQTEVENALNDINNGCAEQNFFSFYNAYSVEATYIGELRGYSCTLNTLGYFNVDRENGVMIVSPNLPQTSMQNIILEYISDGISAGLELVPIELVAALTNGSKAKFCLDKSDARAASYQGFFEAATKNLKTLYRAQRINIYASLFKTLN